MFGFSRKPSRRAQASKQRNRSQFLHRCEALEPRLLLTNTPVSSTLWDYNVIVRFNPSATASQEAAALNSIGASVVKSYQGGLDGLTIASLPADKRNVAGLSQAITTLDNNSNVKYVEPNYVLRASQTFPNDLRFDEQWGMHNIGQGGTGGVPDADIDAPEVWDENTGSRAVIAAVIDTGVDYTHPDLRANMWRNPLEIAGDGIDNDANGYIDDIHGIDALNLDSDPFDDVDHGTHVAGTIGAIGNNGIGVVGVNWNVRIMALKFLGASGGSTAGAIECVNYATQMRLRGENIPVSNNSWGGGAFSFALLDAINTQTASGMVFVAAAGNGGADGVSDDNDSLPAFPTNYNVPNLISVAATDRDDRLGTFSNYGQTTVDLSAPGVEVLSTVPTTVDPTGYAFFDGTSMASPHVAGAVALLANVEPRLTATELKAIILAGVDRIPSLDTFVVTGGRLNIANSLKLVSRFAVQGTVYTDVNNNSVIEPGFDTPMSGVTIYYDENKNAVLDPNELRTQTDGAGNYTLDRLPDPPGGLHIRVVEPPYFAITFPGRRLDNNFYFVDFAPSQKLRTGLDFGLFGPPGEISGHKWLDVNGNASLDPAQGDGPMAGVFLYVDLNGDGVPSLGEPGATTDANGFYRIGPAKVPVGTYFLREKLEPGFGISYPQTGAHQFTMTAQGVLTGFDFFNSPAHDYGDAPNSYRTLKASGGPEHNYVQGFGLGTRIDADADGKPTTGAAGDDNTFTDDEDGVTFLNTPSPGRNFNFSVRVMVPAFRANGYLNAWMDLNQDGDFADAGEKLITGRLLGRGTYSFSVNLPASTPEGFTYLRFRYGSIQNLGFGGADPRGDAGEVEDYRVNVLNVLPVANDDQATVQQFSTNNVIDVLANDVRSIAGNIRIDPGSFPATSQRGGRLVLVTNGTSDPSDDFVRYDAAPAPAGTTPTYSDSFVYTITDGTNQDSATVRITVNRVSTPPKAVDDTYTVRSTGSTTLSGFLNNDIPGTDRGQPYTKVGLFSFESQVTDENGRVIGSVSRNNNGTPADQTDDSLTFTPAAGAAGRTGQFDYVARNPDPTNPATGSTATVTLQVRSDNVIDSNDIIKLSIEVHDTAADGSVAATIPTELVEGRKYWVGILSDDLRPFFRDDTGKPANGALSVYLDLLFDKNYVSPVRVPKTTFNPAGVNIRYQDPYKSGATGFSGDVNTGGLINELGVTSTEDVIGSGDLKVMYVQFQANKITPGTAGVVLWHTDPADQRNALDPSFEHDVTVVNRNDTTQLQDLLTSNIAYFHARSYRIVGSIVPFPSATTSSTSTSQTPTAPQEPLVTSSTSTKSTSAFDAAMASLYAEDNSPYKKR